jgi:hypothetical protein
VVVVGVGGHHARHGRGRDHDGQLAQLVDDGLRGQPGLVQAIGELAAAEHVEQFGQQDFAGAQLELAGARGVQQLARQAGGDDARDEQVGVDDEAHGAWASGALAACLAGGLHLFLYLVLRQGRQIQRVELGHGLAEARGGGRARLACGQELDEVHHLGDAAGRQLLQAFEQA